jgi:hypothetical protein
MTFQQFLKRIITHGLERIGLFYGEYEGEVVEVDERGRVRAKCHALWPAEVDAPANIWAWPGYGPVHIGGGFWWPPAVGDPVWIRCRYGRPTNPVYGPGWWGDDDLPPDASSDLRFLRTPAGWTIEFDDDGDRMRIYNDDESGRIIMEADGRIDLFAGGSNSWFTMLANGSLQHVTAGLTNNRLRINVDGTIFLGLEDENLEIIRLLVELVTSLTTMTIPTAAGPQPPVNLAEFLDILTRLTPYIAPMP